MIKFFSILMFLIFLNTVAIHAKDDSTRMSFKVTVKPHVKQKHRLKPIMSRTSHQIESRLRTLGGRNIDVKIIDDTTITATVNT